MIAAPELEDKDDKMTITHQITAFLNAKSLLKCTLFGLKHVKQMKQNK